MRLIPFFLQELNAIKTTIAINPYSFLEVIKTEIIKLPNNYFTNNRIKIQQTTEKQWQTIPPLWDSIREEVDKRSVFSQFILTGSSVLPQADETIHSGTGRFGRIKMRPMTLFESGDSSGKVSLKQLFIDTTRMPKPSFMMVLTAVGQYAYQRPDGVFVVPIGCLRD